jgi:outer membrane protein assembly factor BamB
LVPARYLTGLAGLVVAFILATTLLLPSIATASTAAPPKWPGRTIAISGGHVFVVAGGTRAVFALSRPLSSPNPAGTLTRIDPTDLRHRTMRTPIPGAEGLVLAGGWLWVVSVRTPGAVRLYRIDPNTLKVVGTSALPGAVSGIDVEAAETAATGGPLWVSVGLRLYALNPKNGRLLHSATLPFSMESLSENPLGTLLYASGRPESVALDQPTLVVDQLNASSGAVLATWSTEFAVGGGSVSATSAGVWVSARSGNAGSSSLLLADTLQSVSSPTPFPVDSPLERATGLGGQTPYESIGGVQGEVSNHVLWLSASSYLACTDPDSQAVRAYELTPADEGTVLSVGRRLYLARAHGLSVIRSPAACFR